MTTAIHRPPVVEPTPSPLRRAAQLPRWRQVPLACALATLLPTLLAGCGGGDDASAPTPVPVTGTVVVGASLGAIAQGAVTITCTPTGVTLGTGLTGTGPTVTVTTTGDCSGPVMVTVRGAADGSSTYFDEATLSTLALPQATSVRALVPAWGQALNVGVTPLTEMAVRQALATAASSTAITAAQVSAANAAVVTQLLGGGVTLDVLSLPTLWNAATAPGALGNTAADRYALYLGALAHMARGQASPALAAMAALATDLADGVLHGSSEGFVYTANSLAAQLSTSLNALAAYASPALQTALSIAPPQPLAASSFTPSHGPADTLVTITGTGFDPDPFHMQVTFANNLAAEVVSSSATTLVVKVPANAVNGPIVVTKGLTGATVTSAASFTVDAPANNPTDAWVARASPSSFLLNGLAYGAGKFVAVGFGKTVLNSINGLSWSAVQGPADNSYYELKAVTWTGTQFVMVGDVVFGATAAPLIATSPDGVSWTRRNWTPGAIPETMLSGVSAGGGKLTAVGMNGVVVSSSNNGSSWAVESQSAVASFHAVAGNDSVRVAVGRDANHDGKILVDTGSGWQLAAAVSGFYPRGVAYTGQFVAVGGTEAGIGNAVVMTSPDGVNWTRRVLDTSVVPAGHSLLAVTRVGDALYATGDNAGNKQIIVKSVDAGVTWTLAHQAQTTGNAMLAGIAASSDRIVTVGGVKSVTLP